MLRVKRFVGILMTLALTIAAPRSAAFGPDGHIIVALIAEDQLTDKAREAVHAILRKGQTLADISNLADTRIRGERPETKPWHYIDMPLNTTTLDENGAYWQNGSNVVQKIEDALSVLKTGEAKNGIATKDQALVFLTHFVADLHQPLHCSSRDDQGGNGATVSFLFAQAQTNLHKVWDTLILRESMGDLDAAAYAKRLLANSDLLAKVKAEPDMTVKEWALQSNKISTDFIYPRLPDNRRINREYASDGARIIDQQLLRAGLRLAKVLNEVFK